MDTRFWSTYTMLARLLGTKFNFEIFFSRQCRYLALYPLIACYGTLGVGWGGIKCILNHHTDNDDVTLKHPNYIDFVRNKELYKPVLCFKRSQQNILLTFQEMTVNLSLHSTTDIF